MKTVLQTTKEIIDLCLKSTYKQRQGSLDYFYIYIHYEGQTPFYIGQGSHNRAYKYKGRSKEWYKTFEKCKDFSIRIIEVDLTYLESINIEKKLIDLHQETLINYSFGRNPKETFSVMCFTEDGRLVKEYNSCEETSVDGFNPHSVSINCNPNNINTRISYKGYRWCYKKDYNKVKNLLFRKGITSKRMVKIIFPNNSFKIYESINSTKEDGFLPAKVREVCLGTRKSHKNCKCEFLNL